MIDHYGSILLRWILPSYFLTSRVKPFHFSWDLSFAVIKPKPTETYKCLLYGYFHRRLSSRHFANELSLRILNVKIFAVTNFYKCQKFGSTLWKLTKINKKYIPVKKLMKIFREKKKKCHPTDFEWHRIKVWLKIWAKLLKYVFKGVH